MPPHHRTLKPCRLPGYPMNRLEHCWYQRCPWLLLLTPVALAYCGFVRLRRWLYLAGWLAAHRLPVPVVIVGNLTAGGTGKTPLVIWLVDFLKAAGYAVLDGK